MSGSRARFAFASLLSLVLIPHGPTVAQTTVAAADSSAPVTQYKPVTSEELLKPSGLAAAAPYVRRHRLQPAQPNQHGEYQESASRVVLRHRRGRRPRGAADRQQRRDVRRNARSADPRARRANRESAVAL